MRSFALHVNKPAGMSSGSVVGKLKYALVQNHYFEKKELRIGHGGTLDPFATGVLIILVGQATKLADTYLHSKKAYTGTVSLGTQTNTGDHTGETTLTLPIPSLDLKAWNTLAQTFVTEPYLQTPPMYSAKKKDGRALYVLARQGIEVKREPILKSISTFKITDILGDSKLQFEAHCESGTYIRVLAEDLAKKAGTIAHLTSLHRIQSSDVLIDHCQDLEETLSHLDQKRPITELSNAAPLKNIASHIERICIEPDAVAQTQNGVPHAIQNLCERANQQYAHATLPRYLIGIHQEEPIALLERVESSTRFRLQRIFHS